MITTLTISGADDLVKHSDLLAISRKYPFVEWGILLSKKRAGSPRYPTVDWIKELLNYPDLNLSGHLCGSYAEDIVYKGNFDHFRPEWNVFKRFQLNFNSESPPTIDFTECLNCVKEKQLIFQIRGCNREYLDLCLKQGRDVNALFDDSGGTGISPESWPEVIPGLFCGYAGGLGPENLEQEIPKILVASKGEKISVDMESKVRDDFDNFDLEKVEKCPVIVQKFMK